MPSPPAPKFMPNQQNPAPVVVLDNVLSQADIDKATAMANRGEFHRQMVFGRSGGQWTINGET